MEITEISISLREEDKLKAFVNVTFNDEFVVRGLKVIKGTSGYFIAMPSRRMPDGSFKDIAHPITSEFRHKLEKAIMEQYQIILEDNKKTTECEESLVE